MAGASLCLARRSFLYPPSSTAGLLTQHSAECFRVIIVVVSLLCGVPVRVKCTEVSQGLRVLSIWYSGPITAAPHRRLHKAKGTTGRLRHLLTPRGSDFQSWVSSWPKVCLCAVGERPFLASIAPVCRKVSPSLVFVAPCGSSSKASLSGGG